MNAIISKNALQTAADLGMVSALPQKRAGTTLIRVHFLFLKFLSNTATSGRMCSFIEFVKWLISRDKADFIRTNKASRSFAVVETISHPTQQAQGDTQKPLTKQKSNTMTNFYHLAALDTDGTPDFDGYYFDYAQATAAMRKIRANGDKSSLILINPTNPQPNERYSVILSYFCGREFECAEGVTYARAQEIQQQTIQAVQYKEFAFADVNGIAIKGVNHG